MAKRVQDKNGDGRGIPTGTVFPFAGTTEPAGWLLCDGSQKSTTTYARLFAVVGTTYGSGAGTFGLPDLRGRAVAGRDNMGGSTASRLTAGGSGITGTTLGAANAGFTETVSLTSVAQLPFHSHDMASHTHSANHDHAATSSGGVSVGHTHSTSTRISGFGSSGGTGNFVRTDTANSDSTSSTGQSADHSHSTDLANIGVTSGAPSNNNTSGIGSGAAMNNTQPTMILNYIIKF